MRQFNRTSCALILLSAIVFASCKKEIGPNVNPTGALNSETSITNGSSCKPVVFGASIGYPGVPNKWVTLMQKWYGQNGKPAFLKAHFFTEMNDFSMLEHSIEWGELSYPNNNQVYLKNGDQVNMRVTVDAQNLPAASYYKHDHFPKGTYLIDTSYYHFTGTRLDAIERLYVNSYGGSSNFAKYNFFYDGFGNLVRIDRWSQNFNTSSMFFSYDYSKPITGMVAIPQVTIPFKLLEYMDLLNFPTHHQLTNAPGFGYNWQFNNYSLTGSGLVSSYDAAGLHQRIFYTGWDCSGVPASAAARSKNNLNSLDDFRRMFPEQK
jgi:hypothetical protein